MIPIKVLVPSGVLGLGFDLEALMNGIKNNPDIISIDGGSTDSGPFSLGSGTSKYSRAAIKAEWKSLMIAREKPMCHWLLVLVALVELTEWLIGWRILQLN